jgi:hypothetical protein
VLYTAQPRQHCHWQANNGYGWDADSQVGGFSANCPAQSLP